MAIGPNPPIIAFGAHHGFRRAKTGRIALYVDYYCWNSEDGFIRTFALQCIHLPSRDQSLDFFTQVIASMVSCAQILGFVAGFAQSNFEITFYAWAGSVAVAMLVSHGRLQHANPSHTLHEVRPFFCSIGRMPSAPLAQVSIPDYPMYTGGEAQFVESLPASDRAFYLGEEDASEDGGDDRPSRGKGKGNSTKSGTKSKSSKRKQQ